MTTATLTKQMRITLVCAGHERRNAVVTLTRTIVGARITWSATSALDERGERIDHGTSGHPTEREALLAIAEWLRRTYGASATCYGGTVTIVGVSPAGVEAA